MCSRKGSCGSIPFTKIFRRLGKTSVILPPTSCCRAAAISSANSLDMYRFFTTVNGSNSSNPRAFSMASFLQNRYKNLPGWMGKPSTVERGGKEGLQTCPMAESCQPGPQHEVRLSDRTYQTVGVRN